MIEYKPRANPIDENILKSFLLHLMVKAVPIESIIATQHHKNSLEFLYVKPSIHKNNELLKTTVVTTAEKIALRTYLSLLYSFLHISMFHSQNLVIKL